jgi:hypothetical protein
VEKLGHLAHRWRYGVVAVEVLVAGGCIYFGWNVVAPPAAATQTRVHHAASAPADASGALTLPAVGLGLARPGAASKPTLQAPNLNADWLSRVNADDYNLYRRQWQVLQLLMSGVRQYVEQRVVPRLLGH